MATKCQKFQPNIFNKLKCQSCFASKELHSSEALENNKASRKVTKCGYLFVSPDFDFNNPLDRGKRWQRRFFRLYDDGELTFSVDEDPETIPQGVADLNKCTDVKDAEKLTTHPNSLAIITPNKTHYIKADSKEEIMWWHDILAVFPRANIKPKNRRFTMPIFSTRDRDKENVQPIEPERKLSSVSSMDSETTTTGRFEVEKLKGKEASFNTFRGVRNMKHRTDKHYQDGLRKSSSLHDLSSEKDDISMGNLASSRFLSRSGDRLNYVSGLENTARILSDASIANNPYCTVTRNTWQSLASNSSAISLPSSSASSSASPPSPQQQQPPPLSAASSHQPIIRRRGSLDEKVAAASTGSLSVAISSMKPKTASERARMHRDRSTSMKDFPTQFVIPKQETNTRKSLSGIDHLSSSTPSANRQGTRNVYEVRNNETDEHKMAKSSELQAAGRTRSTPSIVSTSLSTPPSPSNKYDDLMYMKKGWLIKQGSTDKDWKKHWFVLSGNSLRYYKDAKAEESNNLDGRIDLTNCYDISEVNIGRNFGFRIKSRNGEYVLSAMTSGIRNNWLKAIRLVMDLQSRSKDQTDSEAPRTVDDLDLSSSLDTNRLSGSYDSRSGSESPKELRSRETTKNVRRHYSDVSPANVGKLFSLRDIPLGPARVPAATTTVCVVGAPDPDKNRDKNIPKSLDSPDEFGNNASLNSPTSDNASQLDSMNRFVEGSDNSNLQANAAPESGTSFTRKSESRKEEEEKTRRAKSPSARVRERTKAKASKLVASSVDSDEETAFRMAKSSPRGDNYEAELGSGSSQENLDDYKSSGNVNYDDSNFDSLEGSNSDGVLLELLKTKLDTTTKELVKTQEDNIDLKSKLQTVTREKDLAQSGQPSHGLESPLMRSLWNQQNPASAGDSSNQVNNMRRQLKEARETISKQKTEIESLRSKLDMSSSKLAGTERALSEALKDLKQEKDKFMKLSNDWNKKIRNLESQLKDANHKIDRQKDSFSIKESECKRLEEEVRSNHKKIRENERELLKLKSIEHDYKQMKEKIDEMDKKMIALRSDVREKEHKCKDIESQYERHIRELENEFAQERDDMEQHMEDMKKQYMEAQRQNVQSDMSDLLHEKMEIIARLEEQGIEFEKKIREMSEELQNEVDNNVDLQNTVKKLHAEREKVDKKLKELERVKIQTTSEKQKLEEDNKSLLHHLESYEKDLADLSTQLEDEKDTTAKLGEENEHLQSTISDLHSTIESLEALGMGSNMDDGKLAELLNNFSVVETEMGDVSQTVHDLRKAFENYLKSQRSSSQSNLVGIAQLIDCISTKCEHLQDILKDGLCELDISESKLKQSDSNSEEITILREKYEKALKEANQLKKEVGNSFENCKQLESKNKDLQDNMKKLENNYQEKINTVSTRVDELASVVQDVNKRKSSTPSKPKKENLDVAASWAVSEEIEQQLNELEERITYVDNILKTPDMSAATEDEEEETDEDDEDDSDFLTSEEEDDSEEESEDETENNLLSKLQEMKTQLQTTTSKIRDITADINHQTFTISDDSEQSPGDALKTAMLKYGEKIDSMTSKLNEKMKAVKSGGAVFEGNSLENTLAFHHFVKQMQWKLVELNSLVAEQETLDAKSLGIVHGKVMNLLEYLNNLQRFKHKDYDLLGKITRQNISAQAILNERESRVKRSRLHFEEKVHMYANRLTVEAIILGQMAYLVQRFNMSELYRDVLILEIQGANSVILDLERKIDESTKTISSGEDGVDLVSSYAAILAEKIVLEGRLASCAMAADNQTTDDSAILAGFQITDNPSILAMEVFLRCQLDSSIHKKLQDSSDNMDTVTGHIVTRSLVQGELTHAIQHVKKHFIPPDDQKDVDSLVGKERLFLYEQLKQRCECASTAVDVYLELVVTCLRYNVDQSNSPNLLKSLSAKFSEVFSEKTHYLEDKFASSKGHEKSKYQHLLSAMDEGMSVGLNCLKELGESRTPPSSDNTEVLNITSAEKTLLQLSEILIQRATIKGTVSYISEMMSSGLFPVLPDEDLSASPGNNQLSNTLSVEAEHKQALAAELKTFKGDTASSEDTTRVMELLATIPECGIFNPDIIGSYGETLLREAMHQTQLTYMTYKTKLQYERQMREMKMKIEAGQKVDLPADSNKDAEGDIHASLSIFEEILETKFEDECEVLSILDKEIKELQLAAESGKPYDQHLMNLIQTFDHEMSVAQERHDIHVDVLRQEVNNICLRLEKMMEEHEKDKECMISHYEERIATLQDELDCQKVDHEEELAQVRQDILTAVSAIKANEEHNEVSAAEGGAKEGARSTGLQVENLQKVQDSLSKFSDLLKTSTPPKNVTDQLLKELKLLEAYISEQAEGEIGPMSPLNLSPSKLQTCLSSGDKQTTRQSVNEDGEILDRSQHDYELEMLKKEKDDALAEEMRNTKAALDAMRKAYDEELQEEKEKYREALKTMYTDDFLEEIRRRHSEDMKKLQEELKSVNMHYESKCEDYKLMEDKMLNQKSEFESHIQSLQKSNGHLNELLNEEIEKLKNFVKNKNMARIPGNATLEEELYDAQIMARMKDAELQKLRAQVSNLENSLERSKEEHRNSMTQYLQVLKKYTDLESRCKKEAEKKEEERASNRSLRRTPSFHHRARSPSPQPSPPGSKKDDHHSRDSHRRRHIEPKDLKRSKSSPSLPYVFGGRIPAGSSLGKSLSMKATKSGKSTK